jgi:uncharacterized protein YrrD
MSTTSRKVEELIGLPVFSVHEGQKLGTISGVLIRREERAVEAIGVGGGPFRQARYIRLSQLSTVGTDAVMVPSASVLQQALSAQHVRALEAHLPGRPVMSASGQRLGEVVGFTLQTATGRIESYRIRPDATNKSWIASLIKSETVELSDSMVVSMGANALIVQDEAIHLVKPNAEEAPTVESGSREAAGPTAAQDEAPI